MIERRSAEEWFDEFEEIFVGRYEIDASGPERLAGPINPNIRGYMRSRPDQRSGGRFHSNRPFRHQPQIPQNNQAFDSNGPDIRVRGTAEQIFQRYVALAREATTSSDRIAAENLYQHAEHYFRLSNARREGNSHQSSRPTTPANVPTHITRTGSSEDGIHREEPDL